MRPTCMHGNIGNGLPVEYDAVNVPHVAFN